MSLRSPHFLLASSNPQRMLANLRHVLDPAACHAIEDEINNNVKQLFNLGESHYTFAKDLTHQHWRQRISRFYYGAYNVRRAVNLHENGSFSTDVDDHKKTRLPDGFNNASTYSSQLGVLREDRNLSDYDHTASETDLILTQDQTENLVENFIDDARSYLTQRGIVL